VTTKTKKLNNNFTAYITMFFTNNSPNQTKSYPQALANSMVPVLHLDEDASARQSTYRSQRITEGFIALDSATLNEKTSDGQKYTESGEHHDAMSIPVVIHHYNRCRS
jgi:hypothetical protein